MVEVSIGLDADDGGGVGGVPPLTVLDRGDDYPGMALEYYASRGETPLVWGGSGRAAGPGGAGVARRVRGGLRPGWRP